MIVSAIGQESDLSCLANKSLGEIKTTKWKSIDYDPGSMTTSAAGVFAGGDGASGPKAAIDAIGEGRKAATIIDTYIMTGEVVPMPAEFLSSKAALEKLDKEAFAHIEQTERSHSRKLDPAERIKTFDEVDLGVTPEIVSHEAERCLACGCVTVFDCVLKDYSTVAGAQQTAYTGKFKKSDVDDRHPYVSLDSNKCILCGRCVRYCGDLIGIHALGYINRGYATVVKPAMDKPLAETTCIACGNCIEVCPTGAIEFNYPFKRQAPLKVTSKRSVCSDCGVGCEVDINAYDRDIFYITAKPYEKYLEGELCKKGRFESAYLKNEGRIVRSFEKGRGEVSLDAAAARIADRLGDISMKHGEDSILFIVSPSAANEEIFVVSSLAKHYGSSFIASAEDLNRGEIPDISAQAGINISTATREDVAKADVIINIGSGLTLNSPVFGFNVKRAVSRGAQFIQIGPLNTELERYASLHIDCGTGREGQIINAVARNVIGSPEFDAGRAAAVDGFAEFKAAVRKEKYAKDRKAIEETAAAMLDGAKNVVIVFNDTVEGMNLNALKSAACLLACTGKLSKAHNGIIVAQTSSNSQGYRDIVFSSALGFSSPGKLGEIRQALRKGSIKAVFSLNEQLGGLSKGIEFVAALSVFGNDLSGGAEVVIPYSPNTEAEGSVVAFDGKVVKFKEAFIPLPGFGNLEALNAILHAASGKSYGIDYVRQLIAGKLPYYGRMTDSSAGTFYLADAAREKGLFRL
jgi:formate dehydrogenase major subunit